MRTFVRWEIEGKRRTPTLFALLSVIVLTSSSSIAAAQPAAPPRAARVNHDPLAVPAGTYNVDPDHSALSTSVLHNGIANFIIRFRRFDAAFTYDPAKMEESRVEVTIDPSSIDTGVTGFDSYLATTEDYFNVGKFPQIRFVSTSFKRTAFDTGVLYGNVTFMGVTKPLSFDVKFMGSTVNRNIPIMGFSAHATLKRSDFAFAQGSEGSSDEVAIAVDGEFVKN